MKHSRRILHVIPTVSPLHGGPSESLRQLTQSYRAIGDHVEVLSLDHPSAPYLKNFDLEVHAVGPARGVYGISRPLVRWLARNIERFDLLVINGVWQFHAVAAWRAAIRAHVPYLVFTHGMLDVYFKHRYPIKHLKKMAYWPLQYAILKQARAVLFTSEAERERSAASFRPNQWTSQVVPYGTNRPEGEPAAMVEAFYEHEPALRGKRFLLFLSRIHEKKGCDLLISAFARISARDPELQLVIAGPDGVGLQARLQTQAKKSGIFDRTHWPGMLTGPVKYGALLAAEAFVLPSHQENFGIVVAEALAAGTPVLISDQVNIWREPVEDGVGLAEPDTLDGTTRLLERWLELDPGERLRMATRAPETFDRRYSLKRTAETIHALASDVA